MSRIPSPNASSVFGLCPAREGFRPVGRTQDIHARYLSKENFMNNIGRTAVAFLTGLGIGAGFAALFAPRSGEETREWVAESAERRLRALRRVGRRSVRQLRDAVADGEEKVTEVLRNGTKALESVAARLD